MPTVDELDSADGSVHVVMAEDRPVRRRLLRIGAIVTSAVLAAAVAVIGVRLVGNERPAEGQVTAGSLDARNLAASPPAGIAGTTRLSLMGPLTVLDTRQTSRPEAKSELSLPLPPIPEGTTAVLLEVSIVDSRAAGAVTVRSGAGDLVAVRAPKAGTQSTATVVAPVSANAALRVRTEGGGHLLVNLIGAFVPAKSATGGRIVPIPAAEVVRLVPRTGGKSASFRPTDVAALGDAETVAAVVLQVSADVGPKGGYVETGPSPDELKQHVFWAGTVGSDRTRTGLMIVPVTGDEVHLHYEAGSRLAVSVVAYVTDQSAADQTLGLIVPVPPTVGAPVKVPAGGKTEAGVVGPGPVPADQVAAVLATVTATGAKLGGLKVYPPEGAAPAEPIVMAGAGTPRATVTLVPAKAGKTMMSSTAEATVTFAPQALILSR